MNAELRELLTLLGVGGLEQADAWKRVLLVLNDGCVPARHEMPPIGFKLVVLDAAGRPEWFGRCNWARDAEMERETALIEVITSDPFGRRHVPEVRTARSTKLFLQLSRHLGVRSYLAEYRRRRALEWAADVREILEVNVRLMARLAALLPEIRPFRSLEERQARVERDLATVATAGVAPEAIEALAEVLEGVRALPVVLQHGDLWAANVLRKESRWWLIDFAECGQVWVPLYDLFHLLHTAPPSAGDQWYGATPPTQASAWDQARLALLRVRAAELGLDGMAVDQCLVHYLVHLTAYRLRPGVPRQFSEPWVRRVEAAGLHLARRGHGLLAPYLGPASAP